MSQPSPEANGEQVVDPTRVAADFLFWSFYHSQGAPHAQTAILLYGRREYLAATLSELTPDEHHTVNDQVAQRAHRWITAGPHYRMRQDFVPDAEYISFYGDVLLDPNWFPRKENNFLRQNTPLVSMDSEALTTRIATALIDAEYLLLKRDRGRQGRRGRERPDEFQDPYLSHVVQYGLLRRDPHNPTIDLIQADLHPHYVGRLLDSTVEPDPTFEPRLNFFVPISEKLAHIIGTHLQHHPEDEAPLSDLLALAASHEAEPTT